MFAMLCLAQISEAAIYRKISETAFREKYHSISARFFFASFPRLPALLH